MENTVYANYIKHIEMLCEKSPSIALKKKKIEDEKKALRLKKIAEEKEALRLKEIEEEKKALRLKEIAKAKAEEAKLEKRRGTIEFVNIPAGTFTMGSPISEEYRQENEVQHTVSLDAFKMSRHAITFAQYDAYCDEKGLKKPSDNGWGRGNRPVINVIWHEANAFAEWMGCRLPTEAEWEYACRAGTTTPFNTGYNLTTSQANFCGDNYREKTMPVGSFAPNAWGLYDMHGNVWECCNDWDADYSASAQTNPKGPSTGSYRVYRGGSWFSNANRCRSANRDSYTPDTRSYSVGFRLVSPK